MVSIKLINIKSILFRSHFIIGIYELEENIVFIHAALGDVPKEEITKNTIFPNYIIADFFSFNFNNHIQECIVYTDKKVLYESCCKCECEKNEILLNTLYYNPSGAFYSQNNTLARLIKIRETSICEIGESPKVVNKEDSDCKRYFFSDHEICMSSSFTMESISRITGVINWKLRLTAYLYTEIEEKDNILYFGTAGKGGRFYSISLQNGQILFSYDTGGTTDYLWYRLNILLVDRKGDIIILDSKTGIENRRISLSYFDTKKQKLFALSKMLICNNKLYAVGRHHKNYYELYAICIDLETK